MKNWPILIALLGCSDSTTDAAPPGELVAEAQPEEAPATSSSAVAPEPTPQGPSAPTSAAPIFVETVAEVAVFFHRYQGWDNAGLTGVAAIEDGCLTVSGLVVLWHEALMPTARELVGSLQSSLVSNELGLGGSLTPVVDARVRARCPNAHGAFATGPDPVRGF